MFARLRRSFYEGRAFWASVPSRPLAIVCGAVFFLFSSLAFASDVGSLGRLSVRALIISVFSFGITAVAWVLAIAKGRRFLVIAIALQLLSTIRTSGPPTPISPDNPALAALQTRLRFDAIGLFLSVMLGYTLFIGFIGGQGRRYMRVRTEIALATEIHQLLVPAIHRSIGPFEFFGVSRPSGDVGGDLVDLVEIDETWVAYLADVSGHGVASGTLMGMFKSAVRTRLMSDTELGAALSDVNNVMLDLRKPGMFVTGAFLSKGPDDRLRFTLAGHPPILHYRAASRSIDELVSQHAAIAMLGVQSFDARPIAIEPGDVLALVSDGLIEVFDKRDEEFGLAGLTRTLAAHASRPLPELCGELFAQAKRHGVQLDDQSLLLVKRV